MRTEQSSWLCLDCQIAGTCLAHLDDADITAAYEHCAQEVQANGGYTCTGRLCPSGGAALLVEALSRDGKRVALKVARPARPGVPDEWKPRSVGQTELEALRLVQEQDGVVKLAASAEELDRFSKIDYYPYIALELLDSADGWMHARSMLSHRKMWPLWDVVEMATQWLDAMSVFFETHRPYSDIKLEHLFWNVTTKKVKIIDCNQCTEVSDLSDVLAKEIVGLSCTNILQIIYAHSLMDPELKQRLEAPMTGDGLRPTPSRSLPAADHNRLFSPSMWDFFEKGRRRNLTIDQGASYLRSFASAQESFQSDWWSGVREVYVCALNAEPCRKTIRELANDGEMPQEAYIELRRVVSAFDLFRGR